MTCTACGGTEFDEQGICRNCGASDQPSNETTPGALVAATSSAAVPILLAPEPTPPPEQTPARRFSVPASRTDPAATNPSSGHFCGRCGSAVDAKSDFCGICGNPLKDEALQRLRESRQVSLRPSVVSASLGHITPAGTLPQRKAAARSRIFIICSMILAAVIGVALGVLVVTHHFH